MTNQETTPATTIDLENALQHITQCPPELGVVELIVCRPETGTRQELETAKLDVDLGLVGDNWKERENRKRPGGLAHPDTQLNLMNSRVISAITNNKKRWQLAGDQFFVSLNLSAENLPPGTRLKIGSAVIEVTPEPHLGCKKFVERFGLEAGKFVNSNLGKSLNLRGVNAKVISSGVVEAGASIEKLIES